MNGSRLGAAPAGGRRRTCLYGRHEAAERSIRIAERPKAVIEA
jgi:hypothetical protein